MADSMSTDFSELKKLAADLGEVAPNAGPMIRNAVARTSLEVKKAAQQSVGSSEMWKGAARSISYDITGGGSTLDSEIGYDKSRPGGPLGNLREFGAPDATYGGKSVPLAPHNDLLNALEASQEDFVRGLNAALEDAEKKAGL